MIRMSSVHTKTITKVARIALPALITLVVALGLLVRHSLVERANATDLVTVRTVDKPTSNRSREVTIPPGTVLLVSLNYTLRSDREKSGDGFSARLRKSVVVNQLMVLPAGTVIRGRLLLVAEPYTTAGKAKVTLEFDRIVDPSGRILPISTKPIMFVGQGNRVNKGDLQLPVTVIPAGESASANGVIVFATQSQQIELPSNQHFDVILDENLKVTVAGAKATAEK
jgi:hypothetical protein